MTPDYSIIVPVYKAEPYLRQCVDSILAQTYANFELFLVDDGSPDNCGAICDEYAEKDPRITVIHQSNQGVTAARRAGLARAQADYVYFMDADDYVSDDLLREVEAAAAANGRPDIIMFSYYAFDTNTPSQRRSKPLRLEPGYYDRARLEREVFPYMLYDRRKRFYTRVLDNGYLWTKVFRRRLLLEHFISDARIAVHEDVATSYECAYAANSLFSCPLRLYNYRQLGDSAFHRYRNDYLQQLRWAADYMFAHLGTDPMMADQVNAYFVMRTMTAASRSLKNEKTFSLAVRTFRRDMESAQLAELLYLRGLPPHVQVFMLLVKCRLYRPAVFLVRLRM